MMFMSLKKINKDGAGTIILFYIKLFRSLIVTRSTFDNFFITFHKIPGKIVMKQRKGEAN